MSPVPVMTTRLFSALAVILLAFGISITYWLAGAEDARMRANFLIQAGMAAANIHPAQMKKLTGSPTDTDSLHYQEIKTHLRLLRAANPLCSFIYLTGIRDDGTIFFYVDSELPESEDYSPPGQVYEEVGEDFRRVFHTHEEFVEGPVADRWGNWVSALVPLIDPENDELLGVLGMDIDAGDWNTKIFSRCAPAVSLTLLLGALLTFFYVLFRREEKSRQRIARSESLLAESERAYRSVVTNMLDIYFRIDNQGLFTMLSPSAAKVFGYESITELIGCRADIIWLYPHHFIKFYHKLRCLGEIRDWEFKAGRKNGTELDVSVSVSMVFDASGSPVFFEGIARDISERNRNEKQRQEWEEQIQRAQKMEAVGALAGGVAHDLNNILSGLVTFPDLILSQTPQESPLRGPLEIIRESGIKASVIVHDLLTLARRGVSVREVVGINELIVEYLASPEYLKLLSFHPRVTVQTELDDSLMYVLGSPVHLSKTLMNLVSNAAESMPEGGTLRIITRNRYVDYPIKRYEHVAAGDYVVLTVVDNGVGLSPGDQARVFEPFFTKKKMGRSGTGLGMAVVWGTIKDHHGYIDIQSIEGEGTTFTLYFPVTRQVPSEPRNEYSIEKIRGKGETILVVDDIREQREVASAILDQLGYSVITLSSGEEAVRYLKNNAVDLLLLDMIMSPGIDGLETYQRILRYCPGQKAIICSGFSESDRLKKARRLGVGRYLKKPYTLEGLGVAVQDELAAS
jgi:PAS domain S-box-containing protein